MAPTKIAIFAKTAGRASIISGRLMHSIHNYEPSYSGAGLALFEQSGDPQQLLDAVAHATIEGLGGYTLKGGWTILDVPHPA
ncbi:hypothetical protein [Sphingorhabdus profundilacus]|nr:hypothetical protein [Sphingorhabdus profundilacus]